MADTRQYCTFFLDGYCFGVEVTSVQEVIVYDHVTPMPLDVPGISGLINLRGQIVTAIDLRRRLDLRANDVPEEEPVSLILRTHVGAVSLLIDEIGDVLEVSEAQFERLPAMCRGVTRDLIEGAFKLDDRLLLALDVDGMVSLLSGQPKRAPDGALDAAAGGAPEREPGVDRSTREHRAGAPRPPSGSAATPERAEGAPSASDSEPGHVLAAAAEEMHRLLEASRAEARRLIHAVRGEWKAPAEVPEIPGVPAGRVGELLLLAEERAEEVVHGARTFSDRVLGELDGCVATAVASIQTVRSRLPAGG